MGWVLLKADDLHPAIEYRYKQFRDQHRRGLTDDRESREFLQANPDYGEWLRQQIVREQEEEAAVDPEWMERFGAEEGEEKEGPEAAEEEEEEEPEKVRDRLGAVKVRTRLDPTTGRLITVREPSLGRRRYATERETGEQVGSGLGIARTRSAGKFGEMERDWSDREAAAHADAPRRLARIDANAGEMEEDVPPAGFVSVRGSGEGTKGKEEYWIPKETYERPHHEFRAERGEETDGSAPLEPSAKKKTVVRDPRRAADIALEGIEREASPSAYTARSECRECENGKHDGLKELHHPTAINYEHVPHQSERLQGGRLTEQDALGVNVPHPHDAQHLDEGGLFDTRHPNKHVFRPGDMMSPDDYDSLDEYHDHSEDSGEWGDEHMNTYLGIGEPETGMMKDGTPVPYEVGLNHLLSIRGRERRGVDDTHLGQRYLWLKDNPKRMGAQSRLVHDTLQRQHPDLLQSMEDNRVGKTPCALCAGHGVVTGHRLLNNYAHRADSIAPTQSKEEMEELGYRAAGRPTFLRGTGVIDHEHRSHDMERRTINDELHENSAPWGGQWRSEDPLGEISNDPNADHLCVRCSGLGVCSTCSGEGSVVHGTPDMTAEEADQFNDRAREWMRAHSLAQAAPGQPFVRPDVRSAATVAGKTGVVQSGHGVPPAPGRAEREDRPDFPMGMTGVQVAPSFLQTEPGPGQFSLREQFRGPQYSADEQRARTIQRLRAMRRQRSPWKGFTVRSPEPFRPPYVPKEAVGPDWEMRPMSQERQGQLRRRRDVDAAREGAKFTGLSPSMFDPSPPPGVEIPITESQGVEVPQRPPEMPEMPERGGRGRALFRPFGEDARGFALGSLETTPSSITGEGGVTVPMTHTATPFEHPGGEALWQEFISSEPGGGAMIPPRYKPPTRATKLGQGLWWSDIDEHFRQVGMARNQAGSTLDDWKKAGVEDLVQQDIEAGRRKQAKMFQANVYKQPNLVWHKRRRRDMDSALAQHPELEDLFRRAAASDPSKIEDPGNNSYLAELALYRAIRKVHPDWEPSDGSVRHLQERDMTPPYQFGVPEDEIARSAPLDCAWMLLYDTTLIR